MNNDELLFKQLNSDRYFTLEDLRLNRKYGFLLSQLDLRSFLEFKENNDSRIKLPLKSWNSKCLYYFSNNELSFLLDDYSLYFKDNSYLENNLEEVSIGILASELEGTLKLEGVNTTRRQIQNIIKSNNITDGNYQIIYNMYNGLRFIFDKPAFNKDNLKKLYDLLSDKCLKEDDVLGDSYYRNDVVYIADHQGCPYDKIESCMDSLFEFIDDCINTKNNINKLLIPFIAHYYILYVHPYFDYNGRTARMVQLWIFLLLDSMHTLYLSEAINDNKNAYYNALENTRNSRNDLSYFFIYLIKLCNSYQLVYKNIEGIKYDIESKGDSISQSELHYLKRIIINNKSGWFNYKSFISFAGLDVTKQGALKILNSLEAKNILLSKINSSKEKIFILNDDIILYELKYKI